MPQRKIAVLTGSRADYGRIRPVLRKIANHRYLDYRLIVTGAHLDERFGYTAKEIEMDGFKIDAKVNMLQKGDTGFAMAESIGVAIRGIAKLLKRFKPEIFLISVDRAETLAGAIAGAVMNIPVAHIGGGYITGSIDESIRHAVTKFSHIHFVAAQKHKERLVRLGEDPWRIHVVGAPDLDTIRLKDFATIDIVKGQLDIDLSKPIIVVVQHPVTTESALAGQQMRETLKALAQLKLQSILIYPNSDPGRDKMVKAIKEYENSPWLKTYKNIPHRFFLGLMDLADVLIGNSSAGLLEAPSFGLPVVNIGSRQEGRLQASNVINTSHNGRDIKMAVEKALADKRFKQKAARCKNPYGDGKASGRIVKVLANLKVTRELLQKKLAQ